MQPDSVTVRTYVDPWVVKYGHDWVQITDEMLIDNDTFDGRMVRALARGGLLDQHYLSDRMEYRVKIKEGV